MTEAMRGPELDGFDRTPSRHLGVKPSILPELLRGPSVPPDSYDEVIRLIQMRYASMCNSYQTIALYLTQNPDEVALLSLSKISTACGLCASSIVRFAQTLGFAGYKELRAIFHRRLCNSGPDTDLSPNVEACSQAKKDLSDSLNDQVKGDLAAIEWLRRTISSSQISKAAELLDRAGTIYLLGHLRSSPILEMTRQLLILQGKCAVILDADDCLSLEMSKLMRPKDLLFVLWFRSEGMKVLEIVEEVSRQGTQVLAISNDSLSRLGKLAKVILPIPQRNGSDPLSLVAPVCLAQILSRALAARRQAGPLEGGQK